MDDDDIHDIMISYNWDHSGYADRLEITLKSLGYKIWRDKNKAHEYEDLNIAMAQAVAKSKLILLFVSEKYEHSGNCKLEYDYVSALKKPFIAVKVEDYDPTAGSKLGFMMGTKLFYPIYTDYEQNVKNLLIDIEYKLQREKETSDKEKEEAIKKSCLKKREKVFNQTDSVKYFVVYFHGGVGHAFLDMIMCSGKQSMTYDYVGDNLDRAIHSADKKSRCSIVYEGGEGYKIHTKAGYGAHAPAQLFIFAQQNCK